MQYAPSQVSESADNSDQLISSERQYFSFIVKEQEYAVDILRVVEIRGWTGARDVPGLPPYMKGVIDLRGEVVPIVDLRERFGLPSLAYDQLTVVVILKVQGENKEKTFGIIVDAVSDVYTIYDTQLRPSPDFGGEIDMKYVTSLATVDEKMIILLDVDELLGKQMPAHVEVRHDPAPADGNPATMDDVSVLETSFQAVAPRGRELVARFYEELFRRHPDVKPMFANTSVAEQETKLLAALQLVVNSLRKPEQLNDALKKLGAKHQAYGAEPAHYDAVAAVLLDVLAEFAGDLWNHITRSAWKNALGSIKDTMLSAYQATRETERSGWDDAPIATPSAPPPKKTPTELIESSFAAVGPRAGELATRFYQQLFARYPSVKPMFDGSNMASQQKKLVNALKLVVNNLRHPAKLEHILHEMGNKHQSYGAVATHYDAVSMVLLDCLSEYAGDSWSREHYNAWRDALATVKELMLRGYSDEGLNDAQIRTVESSFDQLAPRADELVAKFYASLFKLYPDVKPMFANVNPKEQKKKLAASLALVVNNLRNPTKLASALKELGRKHQNYGALPDHYDAVTGTMLDVMADMAGPVWTSDVNSAWEAAFGLVKEIMLSGYR